MSNQLVFAYGTSREIIANQLGALQTYFKGPVQLIGLTGEVVEGELYSTTQSMLQNLDEVMAVGRVQIEVGEGLEAWIYMTAQ